MSLVEQVGQIWMDGQYVPSQEAKVHVLTHTLHYGTGVFEGVRAYKTEKGPAIFRLREHTQRLLDSAKIIGMPVDYQVDDVIEVQCEVLKRNQLEAAYIRPLIYYGAEGLSLRTDNLSTHMMVAAWEWGAYLGAENLEKGIRLCTSSYTRHHVNATMCKAKAVSNYVNSVMALQEALAHGYDEGLMLDQSGFVAEGSGENLFLIKGGQIFTPPVTTCLGGITRLSAIKIAQDLGYDVIERSITRDEVYTADEAFFTGTAAEVTPIREVDRRTIGAGTRGPVTEKIQTIFFDVVSGKLPEYHEWLTFI